MEEKTKLAAERDKAMAEAHRKYVEATEKARREYIGTKRKFYPELFAPPPAEATRIIEEQEKTIQDLKAQVKKLEKKEGLR